MDNNFKVKSKRQLKAEYIPLIHDFFVLDQSILITESPIIMNIDNFLKMRIPVKFHSEMQTKIHIIKKFSENKNTYSINSGFYIFHYADVIETHSHIEIYASIYENLDFSKIDIHGRFRKIIINKTTGVIEIKKNMEIEEYNLDFPIKYKNMIIFRNLHGQRVNGFVICEKHEIKNKVFFDDKSICGEPALIEIDNQHYLISLAYSDNAGFLIIINLETFHKIELLLPEKPNIGFHSIFISNKD